MNSAQPHLTWQRTIAILLLLALLSGTLSACSGPHCKRRAGRARRGDLRTVSAQSVTQPLAAAPAAACRIDGNAHAADFDTGPRCRSRHGGARRQAAARHDEHPAARQRPPAEDAQLAHRRHDDHRHRRPTTAWASSRCRATSTSTSSPTTAATRSTSSTTSASRTNPTAAGPSCWARSSRTRSACPSTTTCAVDFESVKKLVDAMGGVEIDVDCALYDPYGYDEGGSPLALDVGRAPAGRRRGVQLRAQPAHWRRPGARAAPAALRLGRAHADPQREPAAACPGHLPGACKARCRPIST